MYIDMFCHFYPPGFLSAYLKTRIPTDLNHILLTSLEITSNPNFKHFTDLETKIRYMDKYDINMETVSFVAPGMWETLEESDFPKFARLANDSLAEAIDRHRDRMIGVAALPTIEGGEMLDELDRSIRDLGLKGCVIFSNIMGKPLDSLEFLPFYERMQKYDLPILIHPAYGKTYDWMFDFRLDHMLQWPFDTSIAMARLVFGGVMKKFPNLKIIAHHLGGMIPFYEGRIGTFNILHRELDDIYTPYARKAESRDVERPINYFKKFYGDTIVSGSLAALKCGYDFFGAEHIVFATDHPFGPEDGEAWTKKEMNNLKNLDIPEEEKEMIREGNARRLLRLDV